MAPADKIVEFGLLYNSSLQIDSAQLFSCSGFARIVHKYFPRATLNTKRENTSIHKRPSTHIIIWHIINNSMFINLIKER